MAGKHRKESGRRIGDKMKRRRNRQKIGTGLAKTKKRLTRAS